MEGIYKMTIIARPKENMRLKKEKLAKKSPNTFRLTKDTSDKIDELAEEYRINRTAVIELAIQKLYNDEFYNSKYPEKTEDQIEYIYNTMKMLEKEMEKAKD